MMRYLFVCMLFVLTPWCKSYAINAIEPISYKLASMAANEKREPIESILLSERQQQFTQHSRQSSLIGNSLSLGWVTTPHWVKLSIETSKNIDQKMFLALAYPLLDYIQVYFLDANEKILSYYQTGDHLPFSQREIFDSHFVFPVDFRKQNVKTIYFYIETSSSLQLPLSFVTEKDYTTNKTYHLIGQGIFYGFLCAMLLYNVFIYLSHRRTAYLHYILFVLSFLILQSGLKGTGFQFLWPQLPFLNDYAIASGGAFSLLFLSLFARSFLHLEEVPFLRKISNYMIVLAMAFIAGSFIFSYSTIIHPLAFTVIVCAILVMLMGWHRYLNGYKEARYYLIAWFAMVTGSIIYLLKQMGLIPLNFITENAMQIGSVMEMMFLSFALADRLNTLQSHIEGVNKRLEKTVKERTQKLELTLEELGEANKQLAAISITDKLTGLKNRYHFDVTLECQFKMAKKQSCTMSLLLLDIDHFKRINDTWGHVVGDKALQFISQCLQEEVKRESDQICRYGGEEFAVLLPNTTINNATQIADDIRQRIELSLFKHEDQHIPITISLGVASTLEIENLCSSQLIRAADIALYKAKDNGRNCVYSFTGLLSEEQKKTVQTSTRFNGLQNPKLSY